MQIGTVKEIRRYPCKSMGGETLRSSTLGPIGIHGDRVWALRDETLGEVATARKIPAILQCTARFRAEPDGEGVPPIDITLPDRTLVSSDLPDVNEVLERAFGRRVSLWPRQPASNRAHYRRAQPGAAVAGWIGQTRTARRILQKIIAVTPIGEQLRTEMSREPDEPMPDMSAFPAELLEFTCPPGTYFDAYPLHILTTASLRAMEQKNPQAKWDVRRFRPNLVIETAPEIDGLVEAGWKGKTLRIGTVEIRCELPTVRCGMTTHPQGELPKDPSILRTIVRDGEQNLGVYAGVAAGGTVKAGDPVEID